jgi:serine/threonine-protein phosphatase 6 regulatory ankyrin repeat subunit B
MKAAYKGSLEVVRLLLEKGANIDSKGNDGSTALKWATDAGHTEVVKLLQERGAH